MRYNIRFCEGEVVSEEGGEFAFCRQDGREAWAQLREPGISSADVENEVHSVTMRPASQLRFHREWMFCSEGRWSGWGVANDYAILGTVYWTTST